MGHGIPIAEMKHCNYENVIATCPYCDCDIIFNRVSDLDTTDPIDGLDTRCLNEKCRQEFRITNDSINERHEMLIFDCHDLLKRKQYMYCVLNLVQAYETFFSLYLRVTLLYKPFASDRRLEKLNNLSERLSQKIKRHPFDAMRKLFLCLVTKQISPIDLDASETIIQTIPSRLSCIPDYAIDAVSDTRLRALLKIVEDVRINKLRNKVVHKEAYRPKLHEVESALSETRRVLFPLSHHFKLRDEINWYSLC